MCKLNLFLLCVALDKFLGNSVSNCKISTTSTENNPFFAPYDLSFDIFSHQSQNDLMEQTLYLQLKQQLYGQ